MQKVAPKKQLGQHFLTDPAIARKIASSIPLGAWDSVVEVGPGMGILTKPLQEVHGKALHCVEIDAESVQWLHQQIWAKELNIMHGDFLAIPE